METSSHRALATTAVALVILTGTHILRSAFAMIVWNIGGGLSQTELLLVSAGIWIAGVAGWAIVPLIDSPRFGLRLALLFAVLYTAVHAVRQSGLSPALAAAALVAWLWLLPALIGELGRPDALDVLVPGILVGTALQVALQTALHGLDISMLRGALPALGAAGIALALALVWHSTLATAPSGAAAFPFPQGWGLFALGPYLVLQQTLLTNLGRVQATSGLEIEQAAVVITLGLAAAAAALPLASRPLTRMLVAPAVVALAGVPTLLRGAGGLFALQVLAAVALAGAMMPAPIPHLRRSYLWGAVGMLFAFALMFLFYSRYEWTELWPLMAALVALASLPQVTTVLPSRTFRATAAILLIGAAALGVSRLTERPIAPPTAEPSDPRAVRLLTYNIHMGFDARGLPDPEAMARVIEAADADVIALQEVGRGWTVNGGVDLAAWLRWRFPGYRVIYGPMNGALWGNVILTRLEVSESGSVRFPLRESLFRRGLTWATVATPRGPLLVVATHFAHDSADDRLEQAEDLLRFWDGRARTAVLGDLNAPPEGPPLLRLREAGLSDPLVPLGLGDAPTWPAHRPRDRIDYVLTSSDLSATGGLVRPTTASDHLPVIVELRVP